MNIEEFRDHCLSKKGVTEETPFGPETIVYKVVGKMFAATGTDRIPATANLKCDPERAIQLRNQYKSIIPGYHMNKQHWNTVTLESELDDRFIKELIDHSYELVASALSKKEKENLEAMRQ
jgi:predicted DNA-binding protein (MmcQ/YjbR family)